MSNIVSQVLSLFIFFFFVKYNNTSRSWRTFYDIQEQRQSIRSSCSCWPWKPIKIQISRRINSIHFLWFSPIKNENVHKKRHQAHTAEILRTIEAKLAELSLLSVGFFVYRIIASFRSIGDPLRTQREKIKRFFVYLVFIYFKFFCARLIAGRPPRECETGELLLMLLVYSHFVHIIMRLVVVFMMEIETTQDEKRKKKKRS